MPLRSRRYLLYARFQEEGVHDKAGEKTTPKILISPKNSPKNTSSGDHTSFFEGVPRPPTVATVNSLEANSTDLEVSKDKLIRIQPTCILSPHFL